MRKNLPIIRRNPFFLYSFLFGIGTILRPKLLEYVVVTDGNELMLFKD